MQTAPGSFFLFASTPHLPSPTSLVKSKTHPAKQNQSRSSGRPGSISTIRDSSKRRSKRRLAFQSSPRRQRREGRAGAGGVPSPRSSGWGRSDVSRPRAARLLLLGSSQAGKQTALTRFALRWVSSHADSFSAPAAGRPAMAPTDKERVLPLPRIPAENVKHTSPQSSHLEAHNGNSEELEQRFWKDCRHWSDTSCG